MSNLTDSHVQGIGATLASVTTQVSPASLLSNVKQSVTLSMPDPVGMAVSKSLSAINSITAVITSRIKLLEQDIVKSVDNTGKVKLVGNTIVITLEPKDAALLPIYQEKIQKSISSVMGSIMKFSALIATLNTITKTTQTLKTLLDVQQALLMTNPISAATFKVLQQGIKIISYRDILNDYVRILGEQVSINGQVLNQMVDSLSKLNVQFVVGNATNQGQSITNQQALASIASTNLQDSGLNTGDSNIDYTDSNGRQLILKVETYSTGELIARARDKFSGSIVVETAPSYIETPDQLLAELKSIIN